jgi:SagB-type dehydrogenase family enzyme
MRKIISSALVPFLVFLFIIYVASSCRVFDQASSYLKYSISGETGKVEDDVGSSMEGGEEIMLSEPYVSGNISLEEALAKRRSVRSFSDRELEMEKISQLLWAAQGITQGPTGYRTAPSAGALYPLELFLVKSDGVYNYRPEGHKMIKLIPEDVRIKLAEGSLFQGFIASAPASIVITAVYERTTGKYGERGIRYVHIEAGHCCQNILLQAVTLDLGAVPVGAFDDEYIRNLLQLPSDHKVLYVIPVGYPQ